MLRRNSIVNFPYDLYLYIKNNNYKEYLEDSKEYEPVVSNTKNLYIQSYEDEFDYGIDNTIRFNIKDDDVFYEVVIYGDHLEEAINKLDELFIDWYYKQDAKRRKYEDKLNKYHMKLRYSSPNKEINMVKPNQPYYQSFDLDNNRYVNYTPLKFYIFKEYLLKRDNDEFYLYINGNLIELRIYNITIDEPNISHTDYMSDNIGKNTKIEIKFIVDEPLRLKYKKEVGTNDKL